MHYERWMIGLLGAGLFKYVTAQADIPEVVFDCSTTPGACTNMCWGAYCSGYEVSLSFDQATQDTKRARRSKAGCGPGNRCGDSSPDPDGNSCDEYPFASVSEADNVQQVNRCISPSEQNSASWDPLLLPESLTYKLFHRSGRNPILLLSKLTP